MTAVLGANIEAKIEPEPNTGCWLWTGSLGRDGYGRMRFPGAPSGASPVLAHRYVYEKLIGPIPAGLTLDHICRMRSCVNPAHLEPVTRRENVLRGVGITAMHARKMTCLNGHQLSGTNLVQGHLRRRGLRRCRICTNAYHREWQRKARKRLQIDR